MKQDIKIPEGYKNSPLGVIPKEWEVKQLKTIFSFKNGMNFKKEKYGNGIKFINTMDVLGNSFMTNKSLRGSISISNEQQKEFAVVNGDVLFNRTSETRKEIGYASVYIDTKKAIFGGFIIRAHDLVNSISLNFKQYCLNASYVRKQISSLGNGAIRYNIGQKDLSTVSIMLPPFPEQQKIAKILSTWDKAIEQQTKIIDLLEQRKHGLMQQLLTGKKRLKGFNDKWEHMKISDIALELSIKNKENNNLVVLSCTKYAGLVSSIDYFKRKIFSDNLSKYKIVPKNHFAYATIHIEEGSIGYQSLYTKALISPMYTVFKTSQLINDHYFFALLKTHKYLHEYKRRIEGSINRRGGLKWNDFSKIPINLPIFLEQTAIAKVLTKTENEINLAKQKLEKFRQQKKGLMQVLLTGNKRINL